MKKTVLFTFVLALIPGMAAAGPEHDHHGHDHAMHQAEVGKPAPDFTLTDLEGNEHSLKEYVDAGKTVILEWFNPDCPFVKKHHANTKSMASTRAAFAEKDIVWLAINSGAPGKQGAGKERNLKAVEDYGVSYPLLLDESGEVGKMYGAKTTPQMYIIKDGVLLFNGPIDNKPVPGGDLGDVNYVEDMLNAIFAGKDVEPKQLKSYGCSVKYAS